MSEEEKRLRVRMAQLETETRIKDIHIAKLSEELEKKNAQLAASPVAASKHAALQKDFDKLAILVQKLFAVIERGEAMCEHTLRLKQIDVLEEDLDKLLKNTAL
jgi:hypothetical protein